MKHSDNGKENLSYFFKRGNDIDIFVEDISKESRVMYEQIFAKIFAGKYSVNRVYPLGCRSQVILRCKENKNLRRPRVYIVDGDLFLLTDPNEQLPYGLYRLKKYCIENYLLDADSVINYIDNQLPGLSRKQIVSKVDANKIIDHSGKLFFELFIWYGVARLLGSTLPLTSYGIWHLNASGIVRKKDVLSRIKMIYNDLKTYHNKEVILDAKSKIMANFVELNAKQIDIISAKDILFPYIFKCCDSKLSFKWRKTICMNQLSLSCKPEVFSDLVDFIDAIVQHAKPA